MKKPLFIDINGLTIGLKDSQINLIINTLDLLRLQSVCNKAKVSAIICKPVISTDINNNNPKLNLSFLATGFNGTPAGFDNTCEIEVSKGVWKTKDEVVHAEQNALMFCARFGIPTDGTIIFTSTRPCEMCMKLIVSAGIKYVFYIDNHTDNKVEALVKQFLVCKQIHRADYNKVGSNVSGK